MIGYQKNSLYSWIDDQILFGHHLFVDKIQNITNATNEKLCVLLLRKIDGVGA